jgi:ABC-type histidine transport system ATPase subunit
MNDISCALELRDIHKSFGKREVLKGICLSANTGDVVSILGRSGSGKSTLLRCINFLETPDVGIISVCGTKITVPAQDKERKKLSSSTAVLALRRKIGMVFQSFNLWDHMTVMGNVIEAPVNVLKIPKKEAIDRAQMLLAKVGLSGRAHSYPSQLSGGQQQRVAIARALAIDPQVLLFDEPTSALDPELVGEVLKVIRALAKEGRTMLIVTHEIAFAKEVSSKVIFLDQGEIREQGPPEKVIEAPDSHECQTFLARDLAGK